MSPPAPLASVEGIISGAEARRWTVNLNSGQALQLEVEQQGVDLALELEGPNGDRLIAVDRPNGAWGIEGLCYVATDSGSHMLKVRTLNPSVAGGFALRVQAPGLALSPGLGVAAELACSRTLLAQQQTLTSSLGGEAEVRALVDLAERWQRQGRIYDEAVLRSAAGRRALPLGRLGQARQQLELARGVFARLGRGPGEARASIHLARVELMQGNPIAARKLVQRALATASAGGQADLEAMALNRLADLEIAIGESHQAIDHLRRAQDLWRGLNEQSRETASLFYLGRLYSEELGYFPQAIDTFQDLLQRWPASSQPGRRAAALIGLGWALHRSGRGQEALVPLQEALALSRQAQQPARRAAALDRLGTVRLALGQISEAETLYRQALALASELGNTISAAHSRANLGWLLAEQGHLQQARQELELAREVLQHSGDRDAFAHTEAGLARVYKDLGLRSEASRAIESALDQLRSLRRSANRQRGFLPPDPLWRQYEEIYIDLLMCGDEPAMEDAFLRADAVRSRHLLQALGEAEINLRADAEPDLLMRERRLLSRARLLERALRDLPRGATAEPTRRQLSVERGEVLVELDQVERLLRNAQRQPEVAAAVHSHPSLSALQSLLDLDTWVLSYSLGLRRSYLFILSQEGLDSVQLPARGKIERVARAVHAGYRSVRRPQAVGQAELNARALGQMILGPLAGRGMPRRLVIVADGALALVPFAALPDPDFPDQRLVEQHDLVHVPSLAVLEVLRVRPSKPQQRSLAMLADPVFTRSDDRMPGSLSRGDLDGGSPTGIGLDGTALAGGDVTSALRRLPHSKVEAEAILALLPEELTTALLGFDAQRRAVETGELAGHSVLHLATHTVIDTSRPGRSGLLLSQWGPQGEAIDGDVLLNEIATLPLRCELVVLSACSTARGLAHSEDGQLGLTGAFLHAGARRVLVSLWEVDDEATAYLMIELYRGLIQQELEPAAALRAAQRHIARDPRWGHPVFWAGFVLHGDWLPLQLAHDSPAYEATRD